jgi:hypothetical protein
MERGEEFWATYIKAPVGGDFMKGAIGRLG